MSIFEAFPGHNELATFEDVRRSLEGAVVRDADGNMRPGVFFNQPGALISGRNDMRVTIGDFRAVQDRGGAIFFGNQGQTVFPPTDEAPWPAAPAANRRIDLLWASSLSTRLGDSESGMTWGIIEGTPSATPVAPELPAALSDALEFATVEIPAGATSLTSPGVIITPKYQYTAMAGGTVTMRNTVELAAWTPADGARAHVLANNGDYVRANGAWMLPGGVVETLQPAIDAAWWEIATQEFLRLANGDIEWVLRVIRTGANLPVNSQGWINSGGSTIATLPTNFRPTRPQPVNGGAYDAGTRPAVMGAVLPNGQIRIQHLSGTQDVVTRAGYGVGGILRLG